MELLTAILLAIVAAPLQGWILQNLWHWFAVPTFGLPELRIPVAMGLILMINFLTRFTVDCEPPRRNASEKIARALALLIVYPLLVLLFGWVIHLFC